MLLYCPSVYNYTPEEALWFGTQQTERPKQTCKLCTALTVSHDGHDSPYFTAPNKCTEVRDDVFVPQLPCDQHLVLEKKRRKKKKTCFVLKCNRNLRGLHCLMLSPASLYRCHRATQRKMKTLLTWTCVTSTTEESKFVRLTASRWPEGMCLVSDTIAPPLNPLPARQTQRLV